MEGVEVQLHAFLNSALDGSEQLTSRPGSFTPGKMYPLDKKLGGVQGQFMHGGQEKNLHPCLERNLNWPHL